MSSPATVPATAPATAALVRSAVLPGQMPDGAEILSVLVKRTYTIARGVCVREQEDRPLFGGDVFWGDPMNSTVRFESDFIPFKLGTDVVLNGTACAPGGRAAQAFDIALDVAGRTKRIRVIGERTARYVEGGTPVFTDPEPFVTLPVRFERAYGGIDVHSDRLASYPYPRNPLGRGFVVANTRAGVDGLALPNLEDPDALLTPERLCIGAYGRWTEQPFPAGFGWLQKTCTPRAERAGILPADRKTEQELRHAYAQLVPPEHRDAYVNNGIRDMDFQFFNGASRGLAFPYLRGGERVATENMLPGGRVEFRLPEDTPRIELDIGEGAKRLDVVLHTVMIRMDDRQVDLVWRGALRYPGRDWLPNLRKLELSVT